MTATDRPPLAELLDLAPHIEGGWFRETWQTGPAFEPSGYNGPRAAASGIYYYLQPHEESRWHTVRSDELWLWHRGGPLRLTLGGAGERPDPGGLTTVVLGSDVEAGQRPQVLVPGGVWQSARPAGGEEVLVSCVVAPGFHYDDFKVLPGD